jgi:hypothetical protein
MDENQNPVLVPDEEKEGETSTAPVPTEEEAI